jgi:hypothetical protein
VPENRAEEDDEAQYPTLTDQESHDQDDSETADRAAMRFRMAVVLAAVAVVVMSGVSSYASAAVAGANTDRHTDQLLAELDRRTAERRAGDAYAAAILEQNRRTLCEVMPAVEPTDAAHMEKLSRLIVTYRCGTARDPIVPPGWSAPPGWPPLPPGPEGFTPKPIPKTTLPGR